MIQYLICRYATRIGKEDDTFIDISSNKRYYFRVAIHHSVLKHIYNYLNSLKTTNKTHCLNIHVHSIIILSNVMSTIPLNKPSSFPFFIDNTEKNKLEFKKYDDCNPRIVAYSSYQIKPYAKFLKKIEDKII